MNIVRHRFGSIRGATYGWITELFDKRVIRVLF